MRIKQIYHHYERWEDYRNGMWRKETREYEEMELPYVIQFTGNHSLYGAAMLRVIKEWPLSCEHNLSNVSINRKAWLGHAACCLERGWPEYLVRSAWGMLTEEQRVKANCMAGYAIRKWEMEHKSKESNTLQLTLWSNA